MQKKINDTNFELLSNKSLFIFGGFFFMTFLLAIAVMVIQVLSLVLLNKYGTSSTNDYYTRYIIQHQSGAYEKRIKLLEQNLQEATRSAYLRSYLGDRYSGLSPFTNDIYDASVYYGLEPSLMVGIAIRESSGCVHYIYSTNNCLGWGGGLWQFTSIPQAFWYVAGQIATSKTYYSFNTAGGKRDYHALAYVYNGGDREGWYRAIANTVSDIREYKTRFLLAKANGGNNQ